MEMTKIKTIPRHGAGMTEREKVKGGARGTIILSM